MNVRAMTSRIAGLMTVSTSNPGLLEAQGLALSRLIPLLYFILVANAWVLAATFAGKAPVWLTIYLASALSIICAARLAIWWRTRGVALTAARVASETRRTNFMAAALTVVFSLWAFALFPYGDALAQSHVAFFLTISIISTMLCLIHIRSAALIVGAIAGTSFVGFFASRGVATFTGMAVNMLLVLVATAIVVLFQNRSFARMVNAQSEARRRWQEESRLLHMIDNMPVAVMTVDPATFKINYVNDSTKRMLRQIEQLLPIKVDELIGASMDIFHSNPTHQRRILADPANLPHKARIKIGPEIFDVQVSAVNATDGSYLGPMLSWALITKEVEAESRIRQLALYDTLTGLPNRVTFRERLEECLASSNQAALLLVDLDGFKFINDTRGHHVGDVLLRQVGERLCAMCNNSRKVVGRLGGDEFAILLPDCNIDRAADIAETVIRALAEPYRVRHDNNLRIGASVGVVQAPAHASDADALLARADIALYAAKAAGKHTFQIFSLEMEARIQDRVGLETKLRNALDRREGLFVFYQPIFDIQTGKITAREALLRWHHPKRGWISPGEFVPVAEESGLMEPLGQFVLNQACREAAGWLDGARVAVNVSANQLGRGTLAQAVLSALAESGLTSSRLEIEVTETALLSDVADTIGDLRRLRDMGVRVALDDFGTGYSSLAHLRAFPFDKIKIDGSFVRDAVERPDCAAVVRSIADLGKRLGVTTVAEGVETQAHLDRVIEEGCSEVQGYLLGRPAPSEQDAAVVEAINGRIMAADIANVPHAAAARR